MNYCQLFIVIELSHLVLLLEMPCYEDFNIFQWVKKFYCFFQLFLFQFLFDHTSDVRFQCCSECKYMNEDSHVPYSNTYQCGYLAVKYPNKWVKEYLIKICQVNGYACKTVDSMVL